MGTWGMGKTLHEGLQRIAVLLHRGEHDPLSPLSAANACFSAWPSFATAMGINPLSPLPLGTACAMALCLRRGPFFISAARSPTCTS